MTLHQGVEQLPQRGERLVLGERRACESADVFAGQAGSDLAEYSTIARLHQGSHRPGLHAVF
jgi:hypothetical protein